MCSSDPKIGVIIAMTNDVMINYDDNKMIKCSCSVLHLAQSFSLRKSINIRPRSISHLVVIGTEHFLQFLEGNLAGRCPIHLIRAGFPRQVLQLSILRN